jgi:DNA mismatch repair protein MutS
VADGFCREPNRWKLMMSSDHPGADLPAPGGAEGTRVNAPVRFQSILFDPPETRADVEGAQEPECFADLNLDQVLASMIAGREEYELASFFYTPVRDVAAVRYRQEILQELERTAVSETVGGFAQRMRAMREQLARADKLRYRYPQESLFLDAVDIYCRAVRTLTEELNDLELRSRGFVGLREHLDDYIASDAFTALAGETRECKEALPRVTYSVHIKGNRVRVDKYEGEADYSAEVQETFAKFRQGAVKDYRFKLPDWFDMNHVEAQILDLVARLYPDVFLALDDYCSRRRDYLDRTIGAFDREVQFYVAYLQYVERLKSAGLRFCYPRVSDRSKEVCANQVFDLALASKLVPEHSAVVCNDFHLTDPERILVVTGPNQGGKTTFARTFGQLHYLAGLGYPVPGRRAQLFLPDRVFTHFEIEEDLATLRGKLEDELFRIHEVLQLATSSSIVVMNESFSSTTLNDALFLGREVIERIIELGSLSVYVTFVDELASLSEATVSMVSTVLPENPAERTYRIVRKPADGLAYAAAIAEKYGLTYESLSRRIAR